MAQLTYSRAFDNIPRRFVGTFSYLKAHEVYTRTISTRSHHAY